MPSTRIDRQSRARRGERSAKQPVRTRRTTSARAGGSRPRRPSTARIRPKSSTGGAFRLSSTPRAALLAILVCALALSVSVPLRTYLSQRAELSAAEHQRAALNQQVQQLRARNAQLSDPAEVEAEARSRLGYVRPGETPYIVDVTPAPAPPPPPAPNAKDTPWYQHVWQSLTHW
jgi:cell division protein FtsB